MRRWHLIGAAVAVAAVLGGGFAVVELMVATAAHAPRAEVAMLMDDDQLIYSSSQQRERTLLALHELGVDVVKVSMVWQLVAPDPESGQRPTFDATDPGSYPQGAWSRWDDLVATARRFGMKVSFLLVGPAPTWAVPLANRTAQGPPLGWAPRPGEYEQFVEAVGRRYSGAYVDPATRETVPRVGYWEIWNEPNERSWLTPYYEPLPRHRRRLEQPQLYRGLVDAAWSGLNRTGHRSDTIMVGETANRGTMAPLAFVRALYCVGDDLTPLRGAAASAFGCPISEPASQFVAQHPGLFAAAYAHHPYPFPYQAPPDRRCPDPTFITLSGVPSLERLLTTIFAGYGRHPGGGVPLYLTEWGFKTNPPNPYVSTSPAQQAEYLNEGEYMTFKEPYVRGLAQFLLVDSSPKSGATPGSPAYWSTFQSGLLYADGSPKPAYAAYRIPVWLPVARHGAHVALWGQLRSADHSTLQRAVIELRPHGSSMWRRLTEVQTSSHEGFIVTHVNIPSAGLLRLAWRDQNGTLAFSRAVPVG